jgi:hypothetical protein
MKKNPLEILLWSIALPGFGQLLNRRYLKGLLLILLEFVINTRSNLNRIIMLSFQGDTQAAVSTVDFQWLLFYPCIYMFGMWDGYKDAGGGAETYDTLPFVGAAFCGTVGIMYSNRASVGGVVMGPVWFPMLLAVIGIGAGHMLRKLLNNRQA